MNNRAGRALAVLVTVAGLVGVTAGCGVDGDPVIAGGATSGSGTTSTADPARVHDLVLDASDFPTGYTAQVVPKGQMQQVMDMLLESTRTADVTPAHCLQASVIPESVDVDDLGLVVATKGSESVVSEAVTVTQVPVEDYREQLNGDCGHLTMDMTVNGQQVHGTADQKIIDEPRTRADDTLVVEMTTVSKVMSQTVTQRVIIGYAQIGGYTVAVQATRMSPTGAPDRTAFDDVFDKAIDKAVDAL